MKIATRLYDKDGYRKYLNALERGCFYDAAKALESPLDQAFCLIFFYTGCRMTEALRLTASHIDLAEGCLVLETLKQRKKGQYRVIPIPDELLNLFRQIIQNADLKPDDRIWGFVRSTGWRRIKKVMAHAGLKGVKATARGLRHSFAISCVMQNIPLTKLKKWMGHASLENTAIYLDFVGKDERDLISKIWQN